MTVYVDRVISGSGQQNFGSAQLQYLLIELDTLGPKVFIADLNNLDQLAQAGWFALGNRSSYDTGIEHVFWSERKWINWKSFLWHPEPTRDFAHATDFAVWATDIRWALSLGTEGHLYVSGF